MTSEEVKKDLVGRQTEYKNGVSCTIVDVERRDGEYVIFELWERLPTMPYPLSVPDHI